VCVGCYIIRDFDDFFQYSLLKSISRFISFPIVHQRPLIYVQPQIYFNKLHLFKCTKKNWTPWPESASELYRPSDHRLSTKLATAFAGRGCHVVSVTDPYVRILWFLDRSRNFFFQVAPQLYSRGWVDPVPDPLLLRKSGNNGNRTRTSGSVTRTWSLDHRGDRFNVHVMLFQTLTLLRATVVHMNSFLLVDR
jgi:hypothetical protein